MPPQSHATLSPSSAARWLTCPASVHAIQVARKNGVIQEEETSVFAAEGTKAHALAEIKGLFAFGLISKSTFGRRYKKWKAESDVDEATMDAMEEHTAAYVAALKMLFDIEPHSQIAFEVKVNPGVPSCWGTSDAVIYSPRHIHIVDLKYGMGVEVDPEDNPQLKLYALGALKKYGDILGDTEWVDMTIFQPRIGDGTPKTATLPVSELRAWGEFANWRADIALHAPKPEFQPSEAACRWCPLSGVCRARAETMLAVDFDETPDTLEPDELSDILSQLSDIESWAKSVRDYATNAIYAQGSTVPGWKTVRGYARRKITDEQEAITRLVGNGFEPEQVSITKVRPFKELDKVAGSSKFINEILEDLIEKREGSITLVKESDKRESVTDTTLTSDFTEV